MHPDKTLCQRLRASLFLVGLTTLTVVAALQAGCDNQQHPLATIGGGPSGAGGSSPSFDGAPPSPTDGSQDALALRDAAPPPEDAVVVVLNPPDGGADASACACGPVHSSPNSFDFSQQPLTCLCGSADAPAACTATLSMFDPSPPWCASASMYSTLRTTGCGRVTYTQAGGYGGGSVTFDATTGVVVGEEEASDIQFGPCNVLEYRWGTTEEACTQNVTCTVCGNAGFEPQCP